MAAAAPPILRLLVCGSVDDGKSTLIGRLLLDTEQVAIDHVAALERDSRVHGTTGGDLDPALLELLEGLDVGADAEALRSGQPISE